MADSKTPYSIASAAYVEEVTAGSGDERKLYEKSKRRERIHGKKWERHKVNINEIVDEFAPDATGIRKGQKFFYRGNPYTVIADMASGYLRIWDKRKRRYITLDGKAVHNRDLTHFKIKKRREM